MVYAGCQADYARQLWGHARGWDMRGGRGWGRGGQDLQGGCCLLQLTLGELIPRCCLVCQSDGILQRCFMLCNICQIYRPPYMPAFIHTFFIHSSAGWPSIYPFICSLNLEFFHDEHVHIKILHSSLCNASQSGGHHSISYACMYATHPLLCMFPFRFRFQLQPGKLETAVSWLDCV